MKELLLYHIEHTFEKEAMQTSLSLAVSGLTAAQAAWKPSADRHSIWQIVRHVIHWKEAQISALDGKPLDYDERNCADWQEVVGDQRDWEADVERLATISEEIRARVRAMDEETLAQGIRWYKQSLRPRPVAIRLLELATHDIYHAGQIQYLFALQEIPVEEFTMAASRNDIGRLERLLRKQGNVVTGYSRDGWTALHVACYFAQKEAVQFLLTRGASVNAVSRNDQAHTPLHSAVTGIANRREIVMLLLQHGADVAARDAKGSAPLDLARQEEDAEVVHLLERGGKHDE